MGGRRMRDDYSVAVDGTINNIAVDSKGRVITSGGNAGPYTLLSNAAGAQNGAAVGPVDGGDYIWRVEGTFGGTTAKLQFLGLNGSTWYDVTEIDGVTVVTLTAIGQKAIGIAQGATIRTVLTGGAPTGMYSSIGGI